MMHREIITKRKVPVIILSLLFITVVLYIAEAIEKSKYNNNTVGSIINILLLTFTIIILLREFISCKMSYKHAIIGDKLIINRINFRKEENLESIKISDIIYIGTKSGIPKEYLVAEKCKSYLCDRLEKKSYYCIYKHNNKINKIKFQPSDLFIEKVNKYAKL